MIGIWADAIMTATLLSNRPHAAPRVARWSGAGFSLRAVLRRWRAARRLSELEALDDRLLADIGLRREQLTPDLVLRPEDGPEGADRRAPPVRGLAAAR